MADKSVVVCFIANKFGKSSLKSLKSILSDFYTVDNLATSKVQLIDDIDALNLSSKRPHVPSRRDGDARLAHEVDDILSLFTFLDEQKALADLPIYVCQNPDNMPSPRLFEGDLNVLMALLHGMEGRLMTIESTMAAICNDIRNLKARPSLPEPAVYCQPASQQVLQPTGQQQPRDKQALPYSRDVQSVGQPSASSMIAGISSAEVSVSEQSADRSTTTVKSRGPDWATMASTPFAHENRFAALSATDDDERGAGNDDQPFLTVRSRRQGRRRRSPPSTQLTSGAGASSQPVRNPRFKQLLGKSTTRGSISAAEKRKSKVVLCVDNVSVHCSVQSMTEFISTLSVTVVTCFEAKSRRRRSDAVSAVNRKAFRVCIYEDDLSRFLNPDAWPEFITISEWFFKANSDRSGNGGAEKRPRIGSDSPSRGTAHLQARVTSVVESAPAVVSVIQGHVGTATERSTSDEVHIDSDSTILVEQNSENMDYLTPGDDGDA